MTDGASGGPVGDAGDGLGMVDMAPVVQKRRSSRLVEVAACAAVEHLEGRRLFAGAWFAPAAQLPTAAGPNSVALGDLNRDGNLDLVTADSGTAANPNSEVSVFLGNGDGTFGPKADSSTQWQSPCSVVVADITGDGKPDIITGNAGAKLVTVMAGGGDGTFENPSGWWWSVPSEPTAIVLADFTGDGQAEMATASAGTGMWMEQYSSYVNQTVSGPYASPPHASQLVAGDVSGDGKLDIVSANAESGTISILQNPNWGIRQDFGVGSANSLPRSVAVGDFNGDGKNDLAVALNGDNCVAVLLGNGDGTFGTEQDYVVASMPASIVAVDIDGDGKLDLATANEGSAASGVSVLMGNGNGTFQGAQSFAAGPGARSIVAGDFNRDGQMDLATANYDGSSVSLLLNRSKTVAVLTAVADTPPDNQSGDITLKYTLWDSVPETCSVMVEYSVDSGAHWHSATASAASEGSSGLATGLHGADHTFVWDSLVDIGTATVRGVLVRVTPSTAENGTAGMTRGFCVKNAPSLPSPPVSFAASVEYAANTKPSSLALGDLNQDGVLDVVCASNGSDTASVFLGIGDGTLKDKVDYATGASPSSVAVGDVNEDGKLDMVVANQGSGSVSVLLGNGDGTFQAKHDFVVGKSPSGVAIADLNHDGHVDLVTSNASDNTFSVLLGNGDGSYQGNRSFAAGVGPWSVAAVDLNGDGILDVVVAAFESLSVSVSLGNGDGTFQANHLIRLGSTSMSYTESVIANDFNSDGKQDLAVANADGMLDVLLGNGDGTFQPAQEYPAPQSPLSVIAADINFDGRLDLVASADPGPSKGIGVLLGMGAGTFGGNQDFGVGAQAIQVVAGDLNGDGRLDLVTANRLEDSLSVLLNTSAMPMLTAAVTTPGGVQKGLVQLEYKLLSPAPQICNVTVEYSLDEGHSWQSASMTTGGDGTNGLAASEIGSVHTFIWDSATDLGNVTVHGVQMRVRPEGGTSGYSSGFVVKNGPNQAPSATVSLDAHIPSYTATLTATATKSDPDGDPVGLTFVWKVDGQVKRTFATATALTDSFALAGITSAVGGDVVTVEVTPNDGVGDGAVAVDTAVANAAPTATFAADGSVSLGSDALVTFSNQLDSAADLAAGLRYSYDFNNDGIYEVNKSTSATCTIPASYLATLGMHTIRGRVFDQYGARTNYTAQLLVTVPPDYFPTASGLSWNYTGTDGTDAATYSCTQSADQLAGNPVLRVHFSETSAGDTTTNDIWYYVDSALVSKARRLYTTATTSWDYEYATPTPDYLRGVESPASCDTTYAVTAKYPGYNIENDGTGAYSVTTTAVGIQPLSLSNGLYFSESLLITETYLQTMHLPLTGGGYMDTKTNGVWSSWFVRGLGLVKQTDSFSYYGNTHGQEHSYDGGSTKELSSIPTWTNFLTWSGNTLQVNGTSGDDTIRFAVSGNNLTCYRNDIPQTVTLADVHGVAINGLDGNDLLDASALNVPVTIVGGAGSDTITGGLAADYIDGGLGGDVISGGGGNDTLAGGGGADVISGNGGSDLILGGGGADTMYGNSGSDTLLGGAGADVIFGQAGNDSLNGGAGNDAIYGAAGVDTIVGGTGNDLAYSGGGNDFVYVNEGAASAFRDSVFTGTGMDQVAHDPADLVVGTYVDLLV